MMRQRNMQTTTNPQLGLLDGLMLAAPTNNFWLAKTRLQSIACRRLRTGIRASSRGSNGCTVRILLGAWHLGKKRVARGRRKKAIRLDGLFPAILDDASKENYERTST
jgi:hypothetical protein